jgi:Kdo2-lipid IVA lauroyltransferase/acyltransferase
MDETPRLRHRLEYAVARGLFGFFGALPAWAGRPLGRALGRAVGLVVRSRSRRAAANLRAAFPEAAPAQVSRWVRGMWRNVGEAAWEFARTPRLTAETYFREVDVEGLEPFKASMAKGNGVVLYAAHLTNWEWSSLFAPFSGVRMAAVARRMKNPLFDAFITRVRTSQGVSILSHRNAVREGLRWLKGGGCLGILVDQRITAGGVQAPFFGRPAHTTTMPALLAQRTGAALHGIAARREGGKLRLRITPAWDVAPFGGDAAALTAAINKDLESWIRPDPSLWLWMHDRWKI